MGTLRISGSSVTLTSKYRVTARVVGLAKEVTEPTQAIGYLAFQIKGLPEGARITNGRCSCLVSGGRKGVYGLAGQIGATSATVSRDWSGVKNGSRCTVIVSWKATPGGNEEGAPYPGKEYSKSCTFNGAILELSYEGGSGGGGGSGGDHEDIGQSGSLIFPVSPGKTGSGFFYYPEGSTNFSRNGLALRPGEALIEGQDNGEFSASLQLLMEDNKKWQLIGRRGILRMPAPAQKILTASAESNAPKLDQLTASAGRGYLYLYSAPTSLDGKSYNLGRVNNGETLIKLSETQGENGLWYRATAEKSGITGYCAAADVTASGSAAEQKSLMQMQERDQLFRIWDIETDEGSGILSIQARHIFYDLSKAILIGDGAKIENVTIQAALRMLRDCADHPIPFSFYTDCAGTVTGDFRGKNIVEALLDPEDGLCAQVGAHISRDNFDVYLMQSLKENRGVRIEHGRNVEGAKCTYSSEKTANRIIAVMDGTYTVHDDEKRGSEEEILAVFRKYDKKNGSAQEQARAEFESGLAGVDFEMEVDFVLLSETSFYARYAGMQKLFLGDEMHLTLRQGSFLCEMTGYTYNGILKKYDRVQVGATAVSKSRDSITGYQIGGVSAGKLLGQVAGNQIEDGAISRLKIQEALIQDLNADAIAAISAEIQRLAAGEVTTDKLYAALATIASAQITAANIEKAKIDWAEIATLNAKIAEIAKAQITSANIEEANIQWAEIESLSAQMASVAKAQINTANIAEANIDWAKITSLSTVIAEIATARIRNADIDFAHIKDLTAGTAIITQGVGGELYISRLAVTEANMVSLSVGQLLVKGQDGGFYALTVDENGNVTTEKKQVANDDIGNLSINAGEKLIEGSLTAATLNARDIFADSAIIRFLIAANLDVDTLFAREATIEAINALDIRGNQYLKLSVDALRQEIEASASDATGQQMTISFSQGNAIEEERKSITASVHIWKNGEEITDQIPAPAFSWVMEGGGEGTWYCVKEVTLTREQIGKSCQLRCILDEAGSFGTFEIVDGELILTRPDTGVTDAFSLRDGNLYGEDHYSLENGTLTRNAASNKMQVTTSAFDHSILETSHILIKDNAIDIRSGGNINIAAGGSLNMAASALKLTATTTLDDELKNNAQAASNAQNAASNAQSAANAAQGTANSASTAAANAQQTANAANTAAGNAQSTANAANTAAGNAQSAANAAQADVNATKERVTTLEMANGEFAVKILEVEAKANETPSKVVNTAMTLDANGIEMNTSGAFRLYANDGKNSRIKLGGDDSSANFSVDESGALGAITGSFAEGLTVGGKGVWTKGNIIISSTQPENVHDVIWLQPLAGVQQAVHDVKNENQYHFYNNTAINYTLTPQSNDVLAAGGSYSYSLELELTLGENTTTVKNFTVSAVISNGSGSVNLTAPTVSLSGWKPVTITLTGTSGVNLCAASGNISAAITVDGPGTGNTYMYIPKNTSLTLTSKNTSASSAGAQTCNIHYIP